MAVTLAQISADVGEIYDAVDGGTTAVTAIISRANSFVSASVGTTAGYDIITRPLADAMVVAQVQGSVDSVNKTIGTLSVGQKDLKSMRSFFEREARSGAKIKGISLDGLSIIFRDCSQ